MSYQDFINAKHKRHLKTGIHCPTVDFALFPFQQHIVKSSLERGRACIFAGTGLGKTIMQCEWARHLPGKRLILAPLAVAGQTIAEADHMLGMTIKRIHSAADADHDGVFIANYDRLHLLTDTAWDGVVLDESSILKSHDGAYRKALQDAFENVPYKLACTATPAPNDYMELGTHAEFMGAMTRTEMLATYFTHCGDDTSKWRLKGHAVRDFWHWVSSWATICSHPRDIGFDQDGYDLPELTMPMHVVGEVFHEHGGLFGDAKPSATELFAMASRSAEARSSKTAELATSDDKPWLIWCHSNEDQSLLEKKIPSAVSVKGSDSEQSKEDRLLGFSEGRYRVLITKPKIAGYGMNWQHCSNMVFCGATYSFEMMYQAVRRCWRFGQKLPVTAHVVVGPEGAQVCGAVELKRMAHEEMTSAAREVLMGVA